MKIGVALSGGGIRGIAHAGVLQALVEHKIPIDIIGGTSAGSMVASLYAVGYSPSMIHQLFKKYAKEIIGISNIPHFYYSFGKKSGITGLQNGESVEKIYDRLARLKGITNFSQIEIPLVIPAVDIMGAKEYIFTNYIPKQETDKNQYMKNIVDKNQYIQDISIGKAVRASSSFPAVFSPCYMENHAFMDGGALDNVPVYEVKKQGADKVLAVKFDADKIDENSNLMDIVMKTIDIMGSKIAEENLEMSDYVLNVCTDKVGLLDIQKLDECYEYGYKSAIENIDEIKKVFNIT